MSALTKKQTSAIWKWFGTSKSKKATSLIQYQWKNIHCWIWLIWLVKGVLAHLSWSVLQMQHPNCCLKVPLHCGQRSQTGQGHGQSSPSPPWDAICALNARLSIHARRSPEVWSRPVPSKSRVLCYGQEPVARVSAPLCYGTSQVCAQVQCHLQPWLVNGKNA